MPLSSQFFYSFFRYTIKGSQRFDLCFQQVTFYKIPPKYAIDLSKGDCVNHSLIYPRTMYEPPMDKRV